jgi:hypothetical protein
MFDIIIIGGGICGLYAGLEIKKVSPKTSFLVLEKSSKEHLECRTDNDLFCGEQIVTGAGIGRYKKDKLLYQLLKDMNISTHVSKSKPRYLFEPINISYVFGYLQKEYKKYKGKHISFKEFVKPIVGNDLYKKLLDTIGYTDYEKEDVEETLFEYELEDNFGLDIFHVEWKKLLIRMRKQIYSHVHYSNHVIEIIKKNDSFEILTEKKKRYECKKIIMATTITSLRNLLHHKIYKEIEGQPFLRIYGKFNEKSIPILKEKIIGMTYVNTYLQKIIPINPNKGIYMISYSDNEHAIFLKKYLKDKRYINHLVERSLNLKPNTLTLLSMKSYFWEVGTHYYKPLKDIYKDRKEFIHKARHPEKNIVVVGEVVADNQGWTEEGLKTIREIKKLLNNI